MRGCPRCQSVVVIGIRFALFIRIPFEKGWPFYRKRSPYYWDRGMKRDRDDAQIIEIVNRCEELILKAKKAAREIEEKVRKEIETLARHNSRRGSAERKAGPSGD